MIHMPHPINFIYGNPSIKVTSFYETISRGYMDARRHKRSFSWILKNTPRETISRLTFNINEIKFVEKPTKRTNNEKPSTSITYKN